MRTPILAAALLLASTGALAQTPPPSSDMPVPSAAPAGRAPVSPEIRAERRAMRQACAADIQSLCADTQAGGGRLMQCFKAHASELSKGCSDAVANLRAERRSAKVVGPS